MTGPRRRDVIAGLGALPIGAHAASAPARVRDEVIDLWPGAGAPGRLRPIAERVTERSTDPARPNRAVTGVVRPRLFATRPERPNGASILLLPGGGYERLAIDNEGSTFARWFAARGVTAFVLWHRLPDEGWASGSDTVLIDVQRALRVIRARAGSFGIDPDGTALMGFSAGGHAAADLATRLDARVAPAIDAVDALPVRPRVAALVFPVISMEAGVTHPGSRRRLLGEAPDAGLARRYSAHLNVTAATPPTFLMHCEDDPVVPSENTLLMRAALRAAGVPVETHLFEKGGHGFGLDQMAGLPVAAWPDLFMRWAKGHGWGGA